MLITFKLYISQNNHRIISIKQSIGSILYLLNTLHPKFMNSLKYYLSMVNYFGKEICLLYSKKRAKYRLKTKMTQKIRNHIKNC